MQTTLCMGLGCHAAVRSESMLCPTCTDQLYDALCAELEADIDLIFERALAKLQLG